MSAVGDNLLGKESPHDFKKKFEEPYAALRAKGIVFYAALGNHDSRLQRLYGDFKSVGGWSRLQLTTRRLRMKRGHS